MRIHTFFYKESQYTHTHTLVMYYYFIYLQSCAMVINSISSDSMMNAAQHYLKYGAQQSAQQSNSEHSDISESYQIGIIYCKYNNLIE